MKATHQEALVFYMFHCFYISKQYFSTVSIISVSCFVYFCCFLKIIAPGWGFSTIFLPQGLGFPTFLMPRGGEFALSKNSVGFALGGGGEWSGLELTDT